MAYHPQQALTLAKALVAEYTLRFSTKVVTQSFDTDGFPTITINDGSPVAGEANVFIKIAPVAWPLAKDSLGNTANIFVPHVCQMATEANYAATTDNIADSLTAAQILAALGPLISTGCRVEWYQSAYATAPTISTITAANLKGTYSPNIYQPLMGVV